MKKRWLLTALLVMAAQLSVQAAPFSDDYLKEIWSTDIGYGLWEKAERKIPIPQVPVIEEPETQTEAPADTTMEVTSVESLIFVGDSRVFGMAEAGGCHYVADIGIGYNWLIGEGITWLQQEMAENPYLPVVFCLGVNDLPNLDSYVAYYQSFLSQYPDKEVYFMSVNPVLEEAEIYSGYTVRNEDIEQFNATLMAAFPDRYIDTYSFLTANGFGTTDGLHYDLNTYAGIQQYTLLMINMMRNFM